MKRAQHKETRSALELGGEAVSVLRNTPALAWLGYGVGAVPFLLAVLLFWSDMSRTAEAADHLGVASLGLTILFFWSKFWQSFFCRQLQAEISGHPPAPLALKQVLRVVATQAT